MTVPQASGTPLRYGIPDVEVDKPKGGTINPATFVGHSLVVVFLPAGDAAAQRETDAYCRRARAFSQSDAWLLFIAPTANPSESVIAGCHAIGIDPEGLVWRAFLGLLERDSVGPREAGGVFLFSRGGGLERCWFGRGHADAVAGELIRPTDW